MTCDKCGRSKGTIVTAGGYIICAPCAAKLDAQIAARKLVRPTPIG
jgi:hypothetical protein